MPTLWRVVYFVSSLRGLRTVSDGRWVSVGSLVWGRSTDLCYQLSPFPKGTDDTLVTEPSLDVLEVIGWPWTLEELRVSQSVRVARVGASLTMVPRILTFHKRVSSSVFGGKYLLTEWVFKFVSHLCLYRFWP